MASLLYYIDKEDRRGTLSVLAGDGVVRMSSVQRLPGCSKSPSSCMVWLLLEEAGLWPVPEGYWILDLTFGVGQFYNTRYFRGVRIAGYDIRKLDWRRRPDWFRVAPAWASLYDLGRGVLPEPVHVVVVDPPWQRCVKGNGCRGLRFLVGGRWWYRASRSVGNPMQILESGARLAGELGVPLLVHFEREWVPEGFAPLVSVYWRPSLPHASEGYRTWWGILVPRR